MVGFEMDKYAKEKKLGVWVYQSFMVFASCSQKSFLNSQK